MHFLLTYWISYQLAELILQPVNGCLSVCDCMLTTVAMYHYRYMYRLNPAWDPVIPPGKSTPKIPYWTVRFPVRSTTLHGDQLSFRADGLLVTDFCAYVSWLHIESVARCTAQLPVAVTRAASMRQSRLSTNQRSKEFCCCRYCLERDATPCGQYRCWSFRGHRQRRLFDSVAIVCCVWTGAEIRLSTAIDWMHRNGSSYDCF